MDTCGDVTVQSCINSQVFLLSKPLDCLEVNVISQVKGDTIFNTDTVCTQAWLDEL